MGSGVNIGNKVTYWIFCFLCLVHFNENIYHENNKIKLIHNINERKQILNSIKYIDDIIVYKTENELENILCSGKYDKRFLGDDYRDKKITGKTCLLEIIYIDRSHGYSTTKLKNQILNR